MFRRLRLSRRYFSSTFLSRKQRDWLAQIEAYVMFIGYPRSGHSLVGSLLDAHPNVIIAHELNAIKFFQAGFAPEQIFSFIIENSRRAAGTGRKQTGYSYAVPNQWQGAFTQLRIIGDKKGGQSTMMLRSDPELFDMVRDGLNVPIKLIHVIRNPYDIISSMFLRKHRKSLEDYSKDFLSLCATNHEIRRKATGAVFELRHEEFLEGPMKGLGELCRFLGVHGSNGYLEDCASVVFNEPHRSRFEVKWEKDLIEQVQKGMESFEFLDGYCHDA